MAHLTLGCVLALCLCSAVVYGEIRAARSAQFSQASAKAQAGSFGRPIFGPRPPAFGPKPPVGPPPPAFGPRPPIGPPPPAFGPRPPIGPPPPAFGGGLSRPGGSISISKSISISRGGSGGASSNANSQAFGK